MSDTTGDAAASDTTLDTTPTLASEATPTPASEAATTPDIETAAELAAKAVLKRYLAEGRAALVWKLEGLDEYDIRRPLVPTGTNLLGLIKHVASVEAGYLGEVFGRPFGDELPWLADGAEPNADMWATAEQTREWVLDLYERVAAHSEATIDALPLDATGRVPWWAPERATVTVQRIAVHLIAETARHAGHADIVRELIDGAVGLRAVNDNLPGDDEITWSDYRDRLEATARAVAGVAPEA